MNQDGCAGGRARDVTKMKESCLSEVIVMGRDDEVLLRMTLGLLGGGEIEPLSMKMEKLLVTDRMDFCASERDMLGAPGSDLLNVIGM